MLHLCLLFMISLTTLTNANNTTPKLFPTEATPTSSGYLPINSTTGSSIFYTFYEAQAPISPLPQTPILIWLQGGPGCSSMVGNFLELGPYRVEADPQTSLTLSPNSGAWNHLFGLLFFDSPIGTGFSIAGNAEEIPRDQQTVANHLFVALRSFLMLNTLFKSRPIYITGESYGGKYVPAFGAYVLEMNSRLPANRRVNLKGVAIGNGLTDPGTQVGTHGITAYYSGLIDEKQKNEIEEVQRVAVRLVSEEKWAEATDARNQVLGKLENFTGLATLYDLRRRSPYEFDLLDKFLNKDEVQRWLGVKSHVVWEDCSDVVGAALHEDVMKSVKFMVEGLVSESSTSSSFKVLLYQGQFDLRDGVVSTEAWIKTMRWEGLEEYLKSERKIWRVNGEVAGYVQRYGRFSEVVVSGAGHLVPTDQPVNAQAMIEDWVLERGLFAEESETGAAKLKDLK
ncbi:hypothetical protein Syun_022143 [Stephania yunnanensis]|uniref:Carboxypeptidase n=1 Tax=Stephania yunnanensis TaxID=152371 RepID=A0AAP0NSW4_9MAGN